MTPDTDKYRSAHNDSTPPNKTICLCPFHDSSDAQQVYPGFVIIIITMLIPTTPKPQIGMEGAEMDVALLSVW